jgi:pyridoxal phosphate enzyme (YggS family)
MSLISDGLQQVLRRIRDSEKDSGRPAGVVALVAVSKTFDAPDVAEAVDSGQRIFGENYVQEGVDKVLALRELRPDAILQWHFIGPLQSNKTRLVAEHFDWVDSVDRLKIAQRLSEQRPAGLSPLNLCIQVNISGEASKSGVAPEQGIELARAVALLPRLRLRGLMCIPEPSESAHAQRAAFARTRALFEQLRASGLALDTLSMGMSSDLEAAIAEGATQVRIGSAIFGARPPKQQKNEQ